jgi:flagellar basal body-associated protein FliL
MNDTPAATTVPSKKRRGVLTLEWIIIITVVVIGVIGGLGAVRQAIVSELVDLAEAVQALNVKPESEAEAEMGP